MFTKSDEDESIYTNEQNKKYIAHRRIASDNCNSSTQTIRKQQKQYNQTASLFPLTEFSWTKQANGDAINGG